MRFTSLVIELIRARPRLVVWIVVLCQAALWLMVSLVFYRSPILWLLPLLTAVLAIAGIQFRAVSALNYQRHLFQEREIRSVTANTRTDAREFLAFAGAHRLEVTVHPYGLEFADRALSDLANGQFAGAAALIP